MDTYLNVLLEAAWNASIVPFGSEATLYAMQAFGGFDMRLAVVLAAIGSTAGQMMNWWLGLLMLRAKESGAKIIPEATHAKAALFFNKYLVFLLVFSWLPLLKFAVLASGFLRTRFKTALVLVALGNALHYGFLLS